jgi:hypothetical protein
MRGPANQEPVQLIIAGVALPTRVMRRLGNELYLDALREGDQAYTPSPGQTLQIRYEDDLSYWSQNVTVVDVMDPIPLLIVKLVGPPQEIEVRAMPRAHIGVPLQYSLMRPMAETYTTTTLDLSATGLRFPCAFQPWLGLDLRLALRVDRQELILVGRVVRVASATEMRGRPAWVTAVQFVAPPPSTRHRISDLVLRTLVRAEAGHPKRVRGGGKRRGAPSG